jgi:hypothetical protein
VAAEARRSSGVPVADLVAAAVADAGVDREVIMKIHHIILGSVVGVGLLMVPMAQAPLWAAEEESFERFIGPEPESFADPQVAIAAFKAKLTANDFEGTAKLLGLDPVALAKEDNIKENFEAIRQRAAKLFSVEEDGDQRIFLLGDEVWPFPFPLRKTKDGKWEFDTIAGIEEVLNRRIGENELEAIETVRAYIEAQRDYAMEDRDADGVLEYAQKLVSSEGQTDGLYWPMEQGDGESPAGAFVSEQQLRKAKAKGDGYFGYHFRILKGQGNNIAGGRYDYVINDNMIAGYGLVAWPVKYGETGVKTFAVNQAGIIYEKDLGPGTAALVRDIARFNPDKSWDVVND